MAKNIGILVCLLLVILDVAAGILGIQAEVEQNKVQELKSKEELDMPLLTSNLPCFLCIPMDHYGHCILIAGSWNIVKWKGKKI
ncbi:hypothetical protein HAX54_004727 [Datura stramonium]|uniref:Transmembrane protein n=1 Tax=Datura stramonium TaxID=4076 RepID=A0ABS8T8R7_DATST|nr:hypothetical protein [Datura stramonium]